MINLLLRQKERDDVDDGAARGLSKEELVAAIKLAEDRLEELHNWAVSNQLVRLRDLQARLLELEAWEAEPLLLRGQYSGL